MKKELVTIFGGSGFLGRYIVEELAEAGHPIRVAVRRPHEALFLKPLGDVGQIQIVQANVRNEESVARAVDGAGIVVNLVGILFESGKQSFQAVQAKGAALIAEQSAKAGVRHLVHMSAIGADAESDAAYARTKAQGETAVREAFDSATIIRPSIVFGPEDDFFNRFASMARMAPALPLVGAETKFQPVYVGDVARAVMRACDGDKAVAGKTFELGGPKVYSFRQLMELMLKEAHRKRAVIGLPLPLAKLMAIFTGLLPNPPLTLDQVKMLGADNVVAPGAKGFEDLGLKPTPVETILPSYMVQYRPRGQFDTSQY